ncbi:hypothetical protein EDEG_03640 [Edhazardia aedis USNM 41457]|uniref:Uncharacterized protein n=1 Tax=Edhazardia aedis (strain USNM 41457) TaxID=1003232 RepID=J9D1Z8_EDHAE|nr:hypothetical protein EDEG_03640 [Edhazardia aedis USNM 41457]|eukprot:EJW01886.1 hypothetical protein EDEG_03640 [Edhazardia aedis USNM 41457]
MEFETSSDADIRIITPAKSAKAKNNSNGKNIHEEAVNTQKTQNNIVESPHSIENRTKLPHGITENSAKSIVEKSIHLSTSNNLSESQTGSKKVLIKIKDGEKIIEYYQPENDKFIKLYDYLFAGNKQSKLKYKNSIISKFSTLKTINYKPDDECYFIALGKTIPSGIKETAKIDKDTIGVKINFSGGKSMNLELDKNFNVRDLVSLLRKEVDLIFKYFFLNDTVLDLDFKVNDYIEEGDVIDAV